MAFLLGLPLFLLILIGFFAFFFAFFLHFLPTFIAGSRHVHNFWWILVINFFFGWTLIGWVIALVWALNDRPSGAYVYMPPPPYNR